MRVTSAHHNAGAAFRMRTGFGLAVVVAAALAWASPVAAAKPSGVGGGAAASSGTVKVVDADTGIASETDNEPHVCAFYLTFEGATNGESGDWWIVDWPPTGTGSEIVSGSYVIPAGGSTSTSTFDLAAGHYRVEWQADGGATSKHKTFWVDADCAEGDAPPADPPAEPDPTSEPIEEPIEEPAEDPSDEPTDEPVDEPIEEPVDEPAGEPIEDPAEEPADGTLNEPTDEPTDSAEQPAEEPVDDLTQDVAQDPPLDDDPADEPTGQGQAPPEGDVLAAGTVGEPVVDELPDTALPTPGGSDAMATIVAIGLLAVVVGLGPRKRAATA